MQKGTFQPIRGEKSDEVIPLTRMPVVPDWICEEGKRIWREEGPNLLRMGLLSERDIRAFARYCQYAGLFERLSADLQNENLVVVLPNGIEGPNQKFKLAMDCDAKADKYGKQFGLSPSTRKNVPKQEQKQADDPISQLHRSA